MIIITIENCTFINNRRPSAIKVVSNVRIRLEMLISDCIFYGNQNAIDLNNQAWQTVISSRLLISLRNVTFENDFHIIEPLGHKGKQDTKPDTIRILTDPEEYTFELLFKLFSWNKSVLMLYWLHLCIQHVIPERSDVTIHAFGSTPP